MRRDRRAAGTAARTPWPRLVVIASPALEGGCDNCHQLRCRCCRVLNLLSLTTDDCVIPDATTAMRVVATFVGLSDTLFKADLGGPCTWQEKGRWPSHWILPSSGWHPS